MKASFAVLAAAFAEATIVEASCLDVTKGGAIVGAAVYGTEVDDDEKVPSGSTEGKSPGGQECP